jgi:hypothetical protein
VTRYRLPRAAAASALVLAAGAARADSIPRYDVASHCRAVASFGGDYSEMLYGGCIDMEQSAYDKLKDLWTTLPSAMRAHCDSVARVAGPGSYSLLDGCIDMERAAAKENRAKSFQY